MCPIKGKSGRLKGPTHSIRKGGKGAQPLREETRKIIFSLIRSSSPVGEDGGAAGGPVDEDVAAVARDLSVVADFAHVGVLCF